MRSYVNPFRARTSEQIAHQGGDLFVRSFGAEAIDLLPDDLWSQPIIIRSAPGAGKTSLLRAVSAETLQLLAQRPSLNDELSSRLREIGALDSGGAPQVVGFRVPLVRDFRAIVDLEPDLPTASRIFVKLLDARIISAFCYSLESLLPLLEATTLDGLQIESSQMGAASLERLGGQSVASLRIWADRAEGEVLDRLDAVLPLAGGQDGHAALYSLRALSGCRILVRGHRTDLQPLLLLDDGQELASSQRRFLLDALHDRELQLARWYTERYSAMEAESVVGDGEPYRYGHPIRLEAEALRLGASTRRGNRTRNFEKLLADIAVRRASRALHEYDGEERAFTELLDADDKVELLPRAQRAVTTIRQRVLASTPQTARFDDWFKLADTLEPLMAAQRWRELEIVIARDLDRPDLSLFEVPYVGEDLRTRSGSAIREAADLWLRREFGLPFYAGAHRLSKLAAENVEQYLNLSADLFDEMLVGVTLRKGAAISASRQDAAISTAADRFWSTIPDRRMGGRAIQRLLQHVAQLCRNDTYRPKAPYAPGVTGTALTMRDRARLLDPTIRRNMPGAQELFEALHGAIGHNLLRGFTNRSVKSDQYMVLYVNRLICVRYGLPLGYGGFRERSLEEMCGWMLNEVEDQTEPSIQEVLELI